MRSQSRDIDSAETGVPVTFALKTSSGRATVYTTCIKRDGVQKLQPIMCADGWAVRHGTWWWRWRTWVALALAPQDTDGGRDGKRYRS